MFIYDNDFDKKELLLGLGVTSPTDNIETSLKEINLPSGLEKIGYYAVGRHRCLWYRSG